MTCTHPLAEVVLNGPGEPVRLICPCGREWRVLPIEWRVIVADQLPWWRRMLPGGTR